MATTTIGISNHTRYNPRDYPDHGTGYDLTIPRNSYSSWFGFYIPVSELPTGYDQGTYSLLLDGITNHTAFQLNSGFYTINDGIMSPSNGYSSSWIVTDNAINNGEPCILPVFRVRNRIVVLEPQELYVFDLRCVIETSGSSPQPVTAIRAFLGTNQVEAIKLGSNDVTAVYLGTNQIL